MDNINNYYKDKLAERDILMSNLEFTINDTSKNRSETNKLIDDLLTKINRLDSNISLLGCLTDTSNENLEIKKS